MAKKVKKEKPEIIPEGMNKKDYADKAFRKKVTIINGCILLVFLVGIIGIIIGGWYNTKLENEYYEQLEQAYYAERDLVKKQLQEIEEKGGSHEDKRQVKIDVTEENFSYWIYDLDNSYQVEKDSEDYASFGGAEIHLQGKFITKEFTGGAVQYWVYRTHDHSGQSSDHEHTKEETSGEDMIPIEVIFSDEVEIPEDGTWVDVVGVVGPDSTKNLSGIRYAEMTIIDEPEHNHE